MPSVDADAPPVPPVAILGAGAVGAALSRALHRADVPLRAVLSRSEGDARALADAVGAPVASAAVDALPADVRLVVCCVPDDALAEVGQALARVDHPWDASIVLHTSGAWPGAVLAAVAEQGASVGSIHPLMTFTEGMGPEAFDGIPVSLEGDADACRVAERLVALLGARAIRLPSGGKVPYHLAASIASNFFVTLLGMAAEVLGSIGMDREESAALLKPLVAGTWHNLQEHLPEDALTGPIARGDVATVERHVQMLSARLPHLVPVYTALANEAVRVAVRGARLEPAAARRILDVLHAAVEPPSDALFGA